MFRRRPPPPPRPSDEVGRTDQAGVDDLLALLQAIEQTALDLYARRGLPTGAGHYRARGSDGEWEALGAFLSAADRWAMINDSAERGWRYASREAIGARSDHADVRHAAAILSACAGLRQRVGGRPITAQDLADSIRLGAAWRTFELSASTAAPAEPLAFLPPENLQPETAEITLTCKDRTVATASSD